MTYDKDAHYRKICWQCRRGMLEIDFFLLPYVEKRYPHLDAEAQKTFETLLTSTDGDLFNWLMAKTDAPVELMETVEDIRAFSRSHV